MPEFIDILDPVAGAGMVGQVRVDRRPGPDGSAAPPLVILGGMTQTLSSWGGQVRPLSAQRPVIVYEARGQGQTRLDLSDVTPPVHVGDFERLLDALGVAGPVDLCGFSFGGRIALAIAAERPERLRRLVLSGVSAGRGALGRVIVRAWREALRTGDLGALAWISLGDTLGPRYLAANEAVLEAFVKATVERNTFAGISALFSQTMNDAPDSPWAPLALAPRVQAPALLLAGALDRLAPAAELDALAAAFPHGARAEILPDVGHTVAIEAAERWRALVLEFLA
ncbi:2-succinyl-6-hydroxy-2,4-cyclohexadiene-1-carboxylate synthase [Nannocystis exedens]|uniref:2-succinyl-6-hydroxy-2,4-cyclohexadiene-1-carboxylate synthase n=1 Tax=Nannocystis exedens TaxID=54 RepID=A0A1I2HBM4_9BACT|nr:alpha/beta hydrolase [Nannocystis exedens]PCC70088.1 2-hydroxymuconate semialdehyde hydrolase [Nannocystis exedens]SFF27052.1 2-succinyl-6-hydroxy-2,4-cyclohexadiene-1-carboxylate synthase [Nannocystis exedens]